MLETYDELVTYWKTMTTLIPEIKGVTVGSDEDLLTQQNTRIKYPHLWVETPVVTFAGVGGIPVKRLAFAYTVFQNDNQKTNVAANAALSATLALSEKIVAQLLSDSDGGDFSLVLNDEEFEPTRQWSGDNCYGWRGYVVLELPRCECDC